jgi:DNA binding domain, excisionase family
MSELLTTAQTAEYLQLSERTIRQYIKDKKLSASKLGKVWRIRKSDVDMLFNN